ncbi:MAG TPA: hypothetical protein VKX46_18090 [Ktedonobacteraceae bacterium]|nr:hypothetical protein [Ktedonobacteraceae bacterium]
MTTAEKSVYRAPSATILPGWIRVCLAFLALATMNVGIWALFFPFSFYTTFPVPGHHWIAMLPPYNEHLVRDVGALTLSFALLFVWTAISPQRHLMQAILWAWLVYAVPHFIYHINHLMHFPFIDQVGQTVLLGSVILLPIVMLLAILRPSSRPRNTHGHG